MTEQYNHHCLLTFAGFDWRIAGLRPGYIYVERPLGGVFDFERIVIATKDVDWDAYCAAAMTWNQYWAIPDRGEMR